MSGNLSPKGAWTYLAFVSNGVAADPLVGDAAAQGFFDAAHGFLAAHGFAAGLAAAQGFRAAQGLAARFAPPAAHGFFA